MNQPNQLVAGSPVPDTECWVRAVTNESHITKDGTLTLQGLKGAFKATQLAGYSQEMSGDLASQTGGADAIRQAATIRVDAIKQNLQEQGKPVPSKIKFMGLVCATAVELRQPIPVGTAANVIYTPKPNNPAHADFVVRITTDDQLELAKAELSRRLRHIRADNLADRLHNCAG